MVEKKLTSAIIFQGKIKFTNCHREQKTVIEGICINYI